MEAEIAGLGLGPHVELLGSVGEDRVLALLQEADTLALTSIQQGEAAPVAIMEAMACGLAPVCSIIGGTPDMIRDGEDGFLVPQEDVAAIARATGILATNPLRRAAMGQAARATAERIFDHRGNALALRREILGAER
ncbi:glycosyltransferase [Seohaeicola zhoushanensis]